jgi:hypothetical protein
VPAENGTLSRIVCCDCPKARLGIIGARATARIPSTVRRECVRLAGINSLTAMECSSTDHN